MHSHCYIPEPIIPIDLNVSICSYEYCNQPHYSGTNHCNKQCRARDQHKSVPYICNQCDKSYFPKRRDRPDYCSRECYFDSIKTKTVKSSRIHYCDCGVVIRGKRIRCVDCNREHNRKRSSENFISQAQPALNICVCCKSVYIAPDSKNRLYCSRECGTKHYRRTRGNHRRRARHYGCDYEPINKLEIFKRDKYLCGICGGETDKNSHYLDDNFPTVDHVIPMSKQGAHTRDNLQCAHRKCNYMKSNII